MYQPEAIYNPTGQMLPVYQSEAAFLRWARRVLGWVRHDAPADEKAAVVAYVAARLREREAAA